MWMGAPSAAVVDMWQLLTIQIFLELLQMHGTVSLGPSV